MRSGQYLTIGIWRALWNASYFLDLHLEEFQGSGVQSYCRVFQNAKYMSAKASANRLLKKPSIIQATKQKLEKMKDVEKC